MASHVLHLRSGWTRGGYACSPTWGRFLGVTMSVRKMTLGAGYRYLMSSVARMDEAGPAANLTAYYAAHGTPPGRSSAPAWPISAPVSASHPGRR